MEDSILNTTKKLLGIPTDVEDFDTDLIIYINTVFSNINQMGIGPIKCFKITGNTETWQDFDKRWDMELLKTYMCLKVKAMFDPPANSQLAESYDNIAKEQEFRLHSLWDMYMKAEEQSIKDWVEANSNNE